MTSAISNNGIQYRVIANINSQQAALVTLNQQLASGKQHDNLTDYAPADAHQLLNLQNGVTQKQGYLSSMQNATATLSSYDLTFTDIESVNANAVNLAQQYPSFSTTNQPALKAQVSNYLSQLTDDLNQQVNGRYIFSGGRYSTSPVTDLASLTAAPTTTVVNSPALANYDSAYVNSSSTDANAYTSSTVTVDANYTLSYGASSNDPSIQKLVNGIRYLQQAANATDAATYTTALNNATSLLTASGSGIQALHTAVSDNQNVITSETATQNTNITNLQNQIGNIQQVNTADVGVLISQLQTQLQASYSATASLEQLSLAKYL